MRRTLWSALALLGLLLIAGWLSRSGFLATEAARVVIDAAGPFGPLALGVLYSVTVIVSPLAGAPITVAGLAAWGFWEAFAANYLGNLIGSSANFVIAKTAGRPLVQRLAGRDSLAKLDEIAEATGVGTLVVLRLFGGGLFDFVSYAAGLTSMRFGTYFLITNLCGIPALLLFVYMIEQAITLPPLYTVPITGGILVLTVLVPLLVYRRQVERAATGQLQRPDPHPGPLLCLRHTA